MISKIKKRAKMTILSNQNMKMENFSEKNVVTHDSIEEMGNHLTTARIIGDLPEEVSFD